MSRGKETDDYRSAHNPYLFRPPRLPVQHRVAPSLPRCWGYTQKSVRCRLTGGSPLSHPFWSPAHSITTNIETITTRDEKWDAISNESFDMLLLLLYSSSLGKVQNRQRVLTSSAHSKVLEVEHFSPPS